MIGYFVVFPNVYCFEGNRVIFRVDERRRYHVAHIESNPPPLERVFYVGESSYCFDSNGHLWSNSSGGWVLQVLHRALTQAWSELEGGKFPFCRLNKTLIFIAVKQCRSASTSLTGVFPTDNYGAADRHVDGEDIYPLLPLGADQCSIDLWIKELKELRDRLFKPHASRPSIKCPITLCGRTQRRPQALRVSILLFVVTKNY